MANPTNYVGIKRKRRYNLSIIYTLLIIYSFLTLVPFYFLAIRSVVPTVESTKAHLWIPETRPLKSRQKVLRLIDFYNIDIDSFQEKFGIEGYLSPSWSIKKLAKKHDIPLENLMNFFQPMYLYSGWLFVIQGGKFFIATLGTIWVTMASVILAGLLSLATGSVLARFRKRWHMVIYNIYFLQVIIPSAMVMLPLYVIVNNVFGLHDTYTALIILNAQGSALAVMIFTAAVAAIPREIEESFRIDGGNRFQYFLYILIPLTKSGFATFAVIHVPRYWNELTNGLLFLAPGKYTLAPFLNTLVGTYSTNYQTIYSGVLGSILPILLLYFIFRRLFIKAAFVGAVKG